MHAQGVEEQRRDCRLLLSFATAGQQQDTNNSYATIMINGLLQTLHNKACQASRPRSRVQDKVTFPRGRAIPTTVEILQYQRYCTVRRGSRAIRSQPISAVTLKPSC